MTTGVSLTDKHQWVKVRSSFSIYCTHASDKALLQWHNTLFSHELIQCLQIYGESNFAMEIQFSWAGNCEMLEFWLDIFFIIPCYIHDYDFYVQMSSVFWHCAAFYADTNTSKEHAVSIIWFKIILYKLKTAEVSIHSITWVGWNKCGQSKILEAENRQTPDEAVRNCEMGMLRNQDIEWSFSGPQEL